MITNALQSIDYKGPIRPQEVTYTILCQCGHEASETIAVPHTTETRYIECVCPNCKRRNFWFADREAVEEWLKTQEPGASLFEDENGNLVFETGGN